MTGTTVEPRGVSRGVALVLAAILALLLSLILIVVFGLRALGLPVLFNRVSDHGNRVSIEVPTGWRVETPSEGGQITTDDGSSKEGKPYRIPDIHAQSWVGGSGTTYFDVEVGPAPAGGEGDDQSLWVADTCRVFINCVTDQPVRQVQLGGEPAQAHVLSVNGATLYVATVRHDGNLVRYLGSSDVALDRGRELANISDSIRFVR